MMESLVLLRPWWLVALLPAAWLLWRWRIQLRRRSSWEAVIDPELRGALLDGYEARNNRAQPAFWLLALTWCCSIVALAGPAWERLPEPVYKQDDALVLVVDLSLSMYARDLQPSRLTRMKHKVRDLLADRREGTTALVSFAGDAHVVAPLTDDRRTLENLLPALEPRIMPVFGNEPAEAIALAAQLLDGAGTANGQIVLLTDDAGSPDRLAAARGRWPVHVLGIGTAAGAAIPVGEGRYLQDPRTGETVIARVNETALQSAATAGGGRYQRIRNDNADLSALLSRTVNDTREPAGGDDREFDRWREYGYLAAALALPLILIAFRRGAVACIPLVLLVAWQPEPAIAADFGWDDLWSRRDQQAAEALKAGDPERAAALAIDPRRRGEALYRASKHGDAAAAFARDTSHDGHFNRGNALAHAGDLAGALAAYERALESVPDDEDTLHNHDIVRRLLEEQEQSEGDPSQSEQEQENRESEQEQQEGEPESSEGEPGDEAGDEQESENQQQNESQEAEAEESSAGEQSEEQMAEQREDESEEERERQLENLIRRVPDDPGGLLRRKFEHETNLRRRRGERVRQGEQVW